MLYGCRFLCDPKQEKIVRLEIFLCILCTFLFSAVVFLSFTLKRQKSSFQKQFSSISSDFTNRENNLLSNISTLRESFKSQNDSITERKKELDEKEKDYLNRINVLEESLSEEIETRKKITSQKKSSEVRLGLVAETLAPFLDQFNFEPEECSFLGKPIDYISFGEEEITFIEIKSGNAKLNQNQKRIKKQVEDKKIKWKEVRIK
jgi:predicted Holliday junction resolvase-like endonuclease